MSDNFEVVFGILLYRSLRSDIGGIYISRNKVCWYTFGLRLLIAFPLRGDGGKKTPHFNNNVR